MTVRELFIHTATVSTFTGSGFSGDQYAAPVDVSGFLDDGLVLESTTAGERLVSKTMFYTGLENVAVMVPESLVTCNGRNMQVRSVRRRDGGSLLAPASHLEVDLG